MKFSQRIGMRPVKTALQVESIDDDLINRLWNIITESFFEKFDNLPIPPGYETEKGEVCRHIWKEFYNQVIDDIPHYRNGFDVYVNVLSFMNYLKKWFYDAEWFEAYDLIEFIASIEIDSTTVPDFIDDCNCALEKEVAGYRIINRKIVQITSHEEVVEIQEALNQTQKWSSVYSHLQSAIDMLADRKNPDYRNSIKESISAVEAMSIIITGDGSATLGKALATIEKQHALHGSLKVAFSALYGYTSSEGGIRHSLMEAGSSVEFEDAKFMLVTCSAFINFLKTKMKM